MYCGRVRFFFLAVPVYTRWSVPAFFGGGEVGGRGPGINLAIEADGTAQA